MKALYFDCSSGISGNMTLGALMELIDDPNYLVNELKKLNVDGYHIHISKTKKNGITGTYVYVHLEHDEHEFSYRHSYFKDHPKLVIVSAEFKLKRKSAEEIKIEMDKNSSSRKEKQPLEYPSAGSTFKRPEGFYVGTMIEQLGLKGYEVGGAEISTKHAGFIVNKGDATAEDVISLIEYVKEKVFEKYGVKLENEIEIIGEK